MSASPHKSFLVVWLRSQLGGKTMNKIFFLALVLIFMWELKASAYVVPPLPPGTPYNAEFMYWRIEEVISGDVVTLYQEGVKRTVRLGGVGVSVYNSARAKKLLQQLLPQGKEILVVCGRGNHDCDKIVYLWDTTSRKDNLNEYPGKWIFINAVMLQSGLCNLTETNLYKEAMQDAYNNIKK